MSLDFQSIGSPPSNIGPDADAVWADDGDELDLSNVQDTKYEALPPGIYDAQVLKVTDGQSQSSGARMLTWQYGVQVEDDEGRVQTRRFSDYTVLTADGKPRLKKHIVTIDPDFPLSGIKVGDVCDHFPGLPCRISLGVEVYQGTKRNKVRDVLPPAPEMAGAGGFLPR